MADIKISGVSQFFFAAIPWILGLAALTWLAFFSGWFNFSHYVTVLKRMDNRVGVFRPLKNPVKLTLKKEGCLHVERGFLDGNTVTMYIKNDCTHPVDYYEWHWKAIAPDGTVIAQQYSNTNDGMEAGETVERTMDVTGDRRTVEVVVWAQAHL